MLKTCSLWNLMISNEKKVSFNTFFLCLIFLMCVVWLCGFYWFYLTTFRIVQIIWFCKLFHTSNKTAPSFESVLLRGKKVWDSQSSRPQRWIWSLWNHDKTFAKPQHCWFNYTEIEIESNLVCWLIHNSYANDFAMHLNQLKQA